MQAIQTRYKGYNFRSRLEARWAVFFDHIGIAWEYEVDGFTDGRGFSYLPDFCLPKSKTWVEVKGDLSVVPAKWFEQFANANDWGTGLPGMPDSFNTTRGLLWLGNIPDPDSLFQFFPLIQHHEGVHASYAVIGFYPEIPEENETIFNLSAMTGDEIRAALNAILLTKSDNYWPANEVSTAYRAARSARFDHGYQGAT